MTGTDLQKSDLSPTRHVTDLELQKSILCPTNVINPELKKNVQSPTAMTGPELTESGLFQTCVRFTTLHKVAEKKRNAPSCTCACKMTF